MSELVICDKQDIVDIADIIREKSSETGEMTLEMLKEVAGAIESGELELRTGTITLSKDSSSLTIEHNLSKLPKIIYVRHNDSSITAGNVYYPVNFIYIESLQYIYFSAVNGGSYSVKSTVNSGSKYIPYATTIDVYYSNLTENQITLNGLGYSAKYPAGEEYAYFVWG